MDGINPELSNLTCSMTKVSPGDIVFLTSDGISDNFDPVVGKFCVPLKSNPPSASKSCERFFFLNSTIIHLFQTADEELITRYRFPPSRHTKDTS